MTTHSDDGGPIGLPPSAADKYVRYLLSLDPHARRASFSASKKEVAAEFDRLKGCKRCEFVPFVFGLFDHQVI